jgi:mannose-6-phosphate isomerase-like protein (cupin superfamily)
MVKKATDRVLEIKKNLRGGAGDVELLHVFNEKELKGHCRLFAQITLQPGCSIGHHIHENEEEVYHILSGIGTVDDNGVEKQLNPGDSMLIGNGEAHSITNNGNVPLVFLAVILLY